MTDLYEIIEKAEREAYRKGLKLYSIYLKLTQRNTDTADRILDDMIKRKNNLSGSTKETTETLQETAEKDRDIKEIKRTNLFSAGVL